MKPKKIIFTVLKVIGAVILLAALFVGGLALYNKLMLQREANKLEPPGTWVAIDGSRLHVYVDVTSGEQSGGDKPTLVVMSGSGIASPVYEYKTLYAKLSDEYRVVVVEKFGYGYSHVSHVQKDVETLVAQCRTALMMMDEKGPFVLMPHSMSGLEALYWADKYPDEIEAIIGLDMAVPESYAPYDNDYGNLKLLKFFINLGFHRLPFLNPVNNKDLTKEEKKQHRYLVDVMTLNDDILAEAESVNDNAKKVAQLDSPDIPILMFASNGDGTGIASWTKIQREYVARSDKYELVELDCGHNIHRYRSAQIADRIKEFLKNRI